MTWFVITTKGGKKISVRADYFKQTEKGDFFLFSLKNGSTIFVIASNEVYYFAATNKVPSADINISDITAIESEPEVKA